MDSGNWPTQLYVRESLRLQGDFVLTQDDIGTGSRPTKPDSVGLADWGPDVHQTTRVAMTTPGNASLLRTMDEGGVERSEGAVYEVPWRALVPRRQEVTNLIVPVCISASHVAFSSYRLEPQYFALGQSAGVAAAMLLDGTSGSNPLPPVQDINVTQLQARLLAQGLQLFRRDAPPSPPPASLQALVVAPCVPGDGSAAQTWAYQQQDATLRNGLRAGLCLSIFGYSLIPGARAVAAPCHTQDRAPAHQNQEFLWDNAAHLGATSVAPLLSNKVPAIAYCLTRAMVYLSRSCMANVPHLVTFSLTLVPVCKYQTSIGPFRRQACVSTLQHPAVWTSSDAHLLRLGNSSTRLCGQLSDRANSVLPEWAVAHSCCASASRRPLPLPTGFEQPRRFVRVRSSKDPPKWHTLGGQRESIVDCFHDCGCAASDTWFWLCVLWCVVDAAGSKQKRERGGRRGEGKLEVEWEFGATMLFSAQRNRCLANRSSPSSNRWCSWPLCTCRPVRHPPTKRLCCRRRCC